MSAYANDDIWNVIEEHIIEALQADASLGTGGTLAIQTWDQEIPEDISEYQDNLLPAVAVEIINQGSDNVIGFPDLIERTYTGLLLVTVSGGRLAQIKKSVKHYGARVLHVLGQQHQSIKQLSTVTDDLLDAEAGSVRVEITSADITAGRTERSSNLLRGLAEIAMQVYVTYTL